MLYYPRNLKQPRRSLTEGTKNNSVHILPESTLSRNSSITLIFTLNPFYIMKKSILITSAVAGTIGLLAAVSTFAATGTTPTTGTNNVVNKVARAFG